METRRAQVAGTNRPRRCSCCEAHPVITLGARRRPGARPARDGALAARVVTVAEASLRRRRDLHGPGPVMVYPVVRVRRGVVATRGGWPARWRMRRQSSARAARAGGGSRHGLWLGARKLAACGPARPPRRRHPRLRLRRREAARAWRIIVPCGLGSASTGRSPRRRGRPRPAGRGGGGNVVGPRVGRRARAPPLTLSGPAGTSDESLRRKKSCAASSWSTTPIRRELKRTRRSTSARSRSPRWRCAGPCPLRPRVRADGVCTASTCPGCSSACSAIRPTWSSTCASR